ncbi:BA14K family protein [Mesorhizobium muleiense]|uniref:BA14K family protein n=1 Tax=Mesorhizobium muleiense TaxID=1004279 RepID=UPI001F16F4C7|nr:BA14K family protein [Mesorhizobium muleiense]MCF6114427.1 BA14K family protein [Mesorhizobium muleiense]
MNKILSGLHAATLSVSFVAATGSANAAQMFLPQAASVSTDVQAVDHKPWAKRHNFNRNRKFSRHDGSHWNGHRGYREYRRGYRRHGDYWFPLAAFAAGAVISGAIINNNQNRVDHGDSHVQWCYDRYRSYRASDNTFQPNYGRRQQCNSPY